MTKPRRCPWIWVFTTLALASFILALSLPSLLSTSWGKQQLIRFLEPYLPGSLSLGSLKLSWIGTQTIDDIELRDSQGNLLFSCAKLESDAPLWQILFSQEIGHTLLRFVRVNLQEAVAKPVSVDEAAEFQRSSHQPQQASLSPQPSLSILSFPLIPFHGVLAIEDAELSAQVAGRAPIVLQQIELHITSQEKMVQGDIQGVSRQGNGEGQFSLDATLSPQNLLTHAHIVQFPMAVLDQIAALFDPKLEGVFLQTVGPALDLDLSATLSAQTVELALQASAQKFSAQLQTQSHGDTIILEKPALIYFSLPEQLSLSGRCKLTIDRLTIPRSLDLSAVAFAARLEAITPLNLISMASLGSFQALFSTDRLSDQLVCQTSIQGTWLDPFLAQHLGSTFAIQGNGQYRVDERLFSLSASTPRLNLPQTKLLLAEKELKLLQPTIIDYRPAGQETPITLQVNQLAIPLQKMEKMTLNASLIAPYFLAGAWPLADLNAHVKVNTWDQIGVDIAEKHLKTSFEAMLEDKPFKLKFKQPVDLSLFLSQDWIEKILPQIELAAPSVATVHIEPFTLPLSSFDLNSFTCKGNIQSDRFAVERAALEKIFLEFQFQGKQGSISLHMNALARSGKEEMGNLHAKLTLERLRFEPAWDLSQALCTASLDVANFSPHFLDQFLGNGGHWNQALGDSVNLTMELKSTADIQQLSLKANSSLLKGDLAFEIKDQKLRSMQEGAHCDITITPEAYRLFIPSSSLALTAPVRLQCSLSQLSLPLDTPFDRNHPSISPRWPQLLAVGTLHMDNAALTINKRALFLKELHTSLERSQENKPLAFDLTAKASSKGKEGRIELKGSFENPFAPHEELCANVSGQLQQFPSALLDLFVNSSLTPSLLFGDSFNASLQATLTTGNGPFTLQLNAPQANFSCSGEIQHGIMTLSQPLYAQLVMTKELSRALLKETILSSKTPFTLRIEPRGTSIPLFPFNPSQFSLPQVRIELGQVNCQNEGSLNFTLGLLKLGQFSREKELNLWFTPIDLHIQQGVVDWERTEILIADKYEVALWGEVNLMKQWVDMTLGLTSQVLERAFGIRNLPRNYVLQIPMQGPFDDVSINKTKATSKIATLLAWQQKDLAGALAGGAPGALLGGLLDKIGPLPDKDSSAPAAKHPFPWEKEASRAKKSAAEETSSQPEHKARIKQQKKENKLAPFKELLKALR